MGGLVPPKTQAEFDALCDKLAAAGVQPVFCAMADGWPVFPQYALDPVFDSPQGEQLLTRLNNNEITYADIPQVKLMLQWYKKAGDRGWYGKNFVTDGWDHQSEALGSGEAAMAFCWDTWFDTDYDNSAYTYKKEDFGLMPLFMGTADNGTFEGPNVNLLMVNKNSPRKDTALNLITFMSTPENYNAAFNGVATTPVFKGQTTHKPSAQFQGAKEWVDQVGHASMAQPRIIGYSQTEMGKIIVSMMSGQISVDEALRQLDEDRIKTLKALK